MDRVAGRGPLARYPGALKGGHFRKRRKKSHNAENLKGKTLWHFKHQICCKISKRLKGGPFGEKKILGKKVSQCRKTERGTLWSCQYDMLRGKTGKTSLVQFARPNSAIWCNNIL